MLVGNTENHRQNCEFGEETAAYLYGEMEEPQKKAFSSHLENCARCAGEINSFSAIHFSIQNWKAAEFDTLPTPIIEIPSGEPRISANVISVSWFENLRQRFSFGGALVPVGALALVLLFAVFAAFYVNFANKNEIAGGNTNKAFEETSPVTKTDGETKKSITENKDETEIPAPVSTNDSANEIEKVKSPVKNAAPVKVSAKQENLRNNGKTLSKSRDNRIVKTNKNTQPANNRTMPRLNNLPEETEAEELRLADLFAEIGDR
jgi:hypothetical protein